MDYSGSAPVIMKCFKPGTWYPRGLMPYGVILCDDCYERLEAKNVQKEDPEG